MQIPSSASGKKFWFNNWKVSTYNFLCWQSILSFISAAEEGSYCQNLILRKNKTSSSTDIEIIQSQRDMEYTYIRETQTSVFTKVGIIIPVWNETVHFSNSSIELNFFYVDFMFSKFVKFKRIFPKLLISQRRELIMRLDKRHQVPKGWSNFRIDTKTVVSVETSFFRSTTHNHMRFEKCYYLLNLPSIWSLFHEFSPKNI